MLKLGNIDIGGVFLGGTEITEAYLGNQLVYENGWPAVPADGVIFAAGVWGTGLGHSNISAGSTGMTFAARQPGTITGVVFSPNTTRLNMVNNLGSADVRSLAIDGVTLPQVSDGGKNRHYDIPDSLRTRTAHTITIDPGSNQRTITSLSFNI